MTPRAIMPPEHFTFPGIGVVYGRPMPRQFMGRAERYSLHYRVPRLDLVVVASYDESPDWTGLHVSVSGRDRLPSWDELRAIRDAFYPDDVDVMMMFPARSKYVNVHPYCLHLWQTPAEWHVGKDGMI